MMQKKSFKLFAYGCSLLFIAYLLSGCATVPRQAGQLPPPGLYNINGVSYVSLVNFCSQYGINWEYDTFTRTATLSKGLHRINLKVGDKLVLVDGKPEYLSNPVDIYQGTVVMPFKFQERLMPFFGAMRPQAPPGTGPGAGAIAYAARIRKVVIDAGHGGNDPGAIGRTGLREKSVNLDIAKRLAKLLSDDGIQVVMTRSTDQFITLERRVDVANSVKADLFISVHSNANRVKGMNGFEVYYFTPRADDTRRALAAAKDSRPDIGGDCFASDNVNLKATLWDMVYTSSRAESIDLARSICRSIDNDLDTKILGVKGANFFVLRGARMPAILIEIGFVSNRREEQLLRNGYYRQQIAEAVATGIRNYARDYAIMGAKH